MVLFYPAFVCFSVCVSNFTRRFVEGICALTSALLVNFERTIKSDWINCFNFYPLYLSVLFNVPVEDSSKMPMMFFIRQLNNHRLMPLFHNQG